MKKIFVNYKYFDKSCKKVRSGAKVFEVPARLFYGGNQPTPEVYLNIKQQIEYDKDYAPADLRECVEIKIPHPQVFIEA